MPLVAIFFTSVFAKLFEYFAIYMTKKIALSAAAITVFIAALSAIWLTIRALILGIMFAWPPTGSVMGAFYVMLSQILPPNLDAIIAAVVAGDAAVFLYRWNHANVLKTALSMRY